MDRISGVRQKGERVVWVDISQKFRGGASSRRQRSALTALLVLTCALAGVLFAALGAQQAKAASPTTFSDVWSGAWYYTWVTKAAENGLMTGFKDDNGNFTGLFGPDDEVTRAQVATVLWRAAGSPSGGSATFSDVAKGMWYAEPVSWCASVGIVTGYTGGADKGKFCPDRSVTREELATMVYRFAVQQGVDTSGCDESKFYATLDWRSVSSYAVTPLKWTAAMEIMSGVDYHNGTFGLEPQGTATRAQAAKVFSRLYLDVLGSKAQVKDISSTKVILSAKSYTYDGTAKRPAVTVSLDGKALVSGTDFDVTYANNVKVGTASVTVTGKGDYVGALTVPFEIAAAPISAEDIHVGEILLYSDEGYMPADGGYSWVTVNGETVYATCPDVTVTVGGQALTKGVDYLVEDGGVNIDASYSNWSRWDRHYIYTVTVYGIGNYTGSIEMTLIPTVGKIVHNISDATVTVDPATVHYDGTAQEPAVTVSLDDKTLAAGTDYEVAYADNVEIGTATVTVTGVGDCSGAATAQFQITEPDAFATLYSDGTLVFTRDNYQVDGHGTVIQSWSGFENATNGDQPWESRRQGVMSVEFCDVIHPVWTANWFYGCSQLTSIDLTKLDVSNVISMRCMFNDCSRLRTIDVSNWNTASLENAEYMFYCCYVLETIDLSSWDTRNVTSSGYMLSYCNSLVSATWSSSFTLMGALPEGTWYASDGTAYASAALIPAGTSGAFTMMAPVGESGEAALSDAENEAVSMDLAAVDAGSPAGGEADLTEGDANSAEDDANVVDSAADSLENDVELTEDFADPVEGSAELTEVVIDSMEAGAASAEADAEPSGADTSEGEVSQVPEANSSDIEMLLAA